MSTVKYVALGASEGYIIIVNRQFYLSSFSTGLVSACWDLLFLSSTEELEIREMSTEKTQCQ